MSCSTGPIFTKKVVSSSSKWPLQNKAELDFDPYPAQCVYLALSWLIIAPRRVHLAWKQKFAIPNDCARRNVNKSEGIREVSTWTNELYISTSFPSMKRLNCTSLYTSTVEQIFCAHIISGLSKAIARVDFDQHFVIVVNDISFQMC